MIENKSFNAYRLKACNGVRSSYSEDDVSEEYSSAPGRNRLKAETYIPELTSTLSPLSVHLSHIDQSTCTFLHLIPSQITTARMSGKVALRHPLMSPAQRELIHSRVRGLLDGYIRHRPTFQRVLTAGFVLYCLGTTYASLTGRGAKGGTKERASGRRGRGKSPISAIYHYVTVVLSVIALR